MRDIILPTGLDYDTISQIFVRPRLLMDSIRRSLNEQSITVTSCVSVRGKGDWEIICRQIAEDFSFPKVPTHSYNAFLDYLTDLSWLRDNRCALIADISEIDWTDDFSSIFVDVITDAVMELNRLRTRKLILILLV